MTFSSEGELREKGKGGGEHKAPGTPGPNPRDDWHDEGHDEGAQDWVWGRAVTSPVWFQKSTMP